jgi:hypothetical protein
MKTLTGKEIELKSMKMKDRDILTNVRIAKSGETISRLLESVTNLSFEEIENLLIGERTHLCIVLRSLSHPDENYYYTKVQCPYCTERWEQEIDLEKLIVHQIKKEIKEAGYKFKIVLPESKAELRVRLLNGKDEKRIERIRKEKSNMVMSYMAMMRTDSIFQDGKEIKKNIDWFRELSEKDSAHFLNEYDKNDCGVETNIEIDCVNCFSSFDLEIPFGNSFFLGNGRKGMNS